MNGHPLERAIARAAARRFVVGRVSIAPGAHPDYAADDWRDALVVVATGEVTLEGTCGARVRLLHGDVVHLHDLPLRALRNDGTAPAVLVRVSRPRAPP